LDVSTIQVIIIQNTVILIVLLLCVGVGERAVRDCMGKIYEYLKHRVLIGTEMEECEFA
jgi:hypothetical protein